jgi:hypothetical protein
VDRPGLRAFRLVLEKRQTHRRSRRALTHETNHRH